MPDVGEGPVKVRAIAYYLPQFHPIPENDEWWEPGFTEWTNVAKARPLFPGHVQPKLPASLGFYDLRVPEVRHQQAALARRAGIESFCYWHYWFAGRRLLERPFNEVLESGEPDLGFCLGWANETWSGVWHGEPKRVLIEQTYPGDEDHVRHFEALAPAFFDRRYTKVDGRPLFFIFRPDNLPDQARVISFWRSRAERAGLPGLFLVAETTDGDRAIGNGFDGFTTVPSWRQIALGTRYPLAKEASYRLLGPLVGRQSNMTAALNKLARECHPRRCPCVVPGWDNTPRSGRRGIVLTGKTPGQFAEQTKVAVEALANRRFEERLLFVKSWNEWAEGNHMEPDNEWGMSFIEALGEVLGSTGKEATS